MRRIDEYEALFIVCLQFCDSEEELEDDAGRRAKRKLVFAAVLSLVFMVSLGKAVL
jgi:hypothetical protein